MIDEIRLGGTYSNQVASLGEKVDALVLSLGGRDYMIDAEVTELEHQVDRLEFKVDNLVLDVRKFSDKLDELNLVLRYPLCKCGDGLEDRDPDYPNVYNPL